MTTYNISATGGELQIIEGNGNRSFRYERDDTELPFVMALSVVGADSESYHSYKNAQVTVKIDTDPATAEIDKDVALGAAEGVANWTDVLLQLIEDTDCNPDNEEEFNEILMSAQKFLTRYREATKK